MNFLLNYSTNLERPGDLKESFDFSVLEDENFVSNLFLILKYFI